MEETPQSQNQFFLKKFKLSNWAQVLGIVILVSLIAGVGTGYLLASTGGNKFATINLSATPKTPTQDTKTFRDFAEGKIQKRPAPKNPSEYVEGTHFLIRAGAVPVALTSSVVDLTQFEGKEVKVFGETQKAIEEGWLMDVGMVEEK